MKGTNQAAMPHPGKLDENVTPSTGYGTTDAPKRGQGKAAVTRSHFDGQPAPPAGHDEPIATRPAHDDFGAPPPG